jgi:uncharacterized protein (TIGR02300 family)
VLFNPAAAMPSPASVSSAFREGIAFDSGPSSWQVTGRFSHLDQRVANLANPELGAKQICPNCQSKFYDLGRRPALCPKCGESFDPEEALKSRRVRARAVTPDYDAEDEKPVAPPKEPDGYEDEVDETPEIDQAVEADVVDAEDDTDPATTPAAGADDLGVDFAEDEDLAEDEADDVPFLEDEDEEDVLEDEIEGLPGADDDDR